MLILHADLVRDLKRKPGESNVYKNTKRKIWLLPPLLQKSLSLFFFNAAVTVSIINIMLESINFKSQKYDPCLCFHFIFYTYFYSSSFKTSMRDENLLRYLGVKVALSVRQLSHSFQCTVDSE